MSERASLIYRSPWLYDGVMAALYGRHGAMRLSMVAAEVPPASAVLECCCGSGRLYRRHLRGRVTGYIGLDVSDRFVAALRRAGADARVADLAREDGPLPAADVVILQASLYHFLPDPSRLIDRLLAAARDRVIISEPIRNLSSSRVGAIAQLARRATDAGADGSADRFDEATLGAALSPYSERVLRAFPIPGGRDKVYVLRAG